MHWASLSEALFKRIAHSARPGKVNWRKSVLYFMSLFLSVGSVGIVGMVDLFSSVGLVHLFGSVNLFSSGCFGLGAAELVVK